MLAGKMKLSTFLSVLVVGGVCGAAGFAFATFTMEPAAPPPAIAATPPVVVPALPASPPPSAVPGPEALAVDALNAVAAPGARDIDTTLLTYLGKDLGADKLKDVGAGKPWKMNVYQDAGKTTANRAKVDIDRDEKWDEKFTFTDGGIKRQVAPADDEAYTVEYHWDGQGWAAGG
jgi:hypothetical protein